MRPLARFLIAFSVLALVVKRALAESSGSVTWSGRYWR